MTEKERVTVDFDEESYYLDGEYWESWDNYGEEMADKINDLLNEQDKQLQPFIELAKKHDKTIDELYRYLRDSFNSRNENIYWSPNYRW